MVQRRTFVKTIDGREVVQDVYTPADAVALKFNGWRESKSDQPAPAAVAEPAPEPEPALEPAPVAVRPAAARRAARLADPASTSPAELDA